MNNNFLPNEIWISILQYLTIHHNYLIQIQKINKYFFTLIRSFHWSQWITIKDTHNIAYVLRSYHFTKYNFSLSMISHQQIKFVGNSVTKLNLKFCLNINHESILYLSTLPFLRSLQLSFCSQLNNESIRQLTNIKSLNISFCDNLSDESIIHLTNLKKLKIIECSKFTNKILPYLSSLQKLDITGTNLHGENLIYLKNIRSLSYGSNSLSAKDLKYIISPERDYLNLTFCKDLRDSFLEPLGKINKLNLSLNYITDNFLQHSMLTYVQQLNISNTKYITIDGLINNLGNLSSMKILYIDSNKLYDKEFIDENKKLLLESKVKVCYV